MTIKKVTGQRILRFAAIADTHLGPVDGVSPSPWLTNRHASARLRYAIQCINRVGVDFTIHLGDIVHPLPHQDGYKPAAQRFKDAVKELTSPLHLVPGNHDIGDKPADWMPAAHIDENAIAHYQAIFGEDYYSFEQQNTHFIVLNAQLFNTGFTAANKQWEWLEKTLENKSGMRSFVFLHYPPYIVWDNEIEHYDNIGEPSRSRLLALCEKYPVEAVFSGHVHNFFYDLLKNKTELYVLPAITAVRHDYSELFAVTSDDEFGRNDLGKLGFFIVDVYESGHVAHFHRTFGMSEDEGCVQADAVLPRPYVHTKMLPESPLGFDMRGPWAEVRELPLSGVVDEFFKKQARNDYLLDALWTTGARRLRVAAGDLGKPETLHRIRQLVLLGHEFVAYAFDIPDADTAACIQANRELLCGVEIIFPSARFQTISESQAAALNALETPIILSKLWSSQEAKNTNETFTHYIMHGFSADETVLVEHIVGQAPFPVAGVVFRLGQDNQLRTTIPAIVEFCERCGVGAQLYLRLGGGNPARLENQDSTVAALLLETLFEVYPYRDKLSIVLDTLADVERGYFPRYGLFDRRYNPRLGAMAASIFHQSTQTLAAEAVTVQVVKGDGCRGLRLCASRQTVTLLLPLSTDKDGEISLPLSTETGLQVLDPARFLPDQPCWSTTVKNERLYARPVASHAEHAPLIVIEQHA